VVNVIVHPPIRVEEVGGQKKDAGGGEGGMGRVGEAGREGYRGEGGEARRQDGGPLLPWGILGLRLSPLASLEASQLASLPASQPASQPWPP
jgi:hypothetical protein